VGEKGWGGGKGNLNSKKREYILRRKKRGGRGKKKGPGNKPITFGKVRRSKEELFAWGKWPTGSGTKKGVFHSRVEGKGLRGKADGRRRWGGNKRRKNSWSRGGSVEWEEKVHFNTKKGVQPLRGGRGEGRLNTKGGRRKVKGSQVPFGRSLSRKGTRKKGFLLRGKGLNGFMEGETKTRSRGGGGGRALGGKEGKTEGEQESHQRPRNAPRKNVTLKMVSLDGAEKGGVVMEFN